MAPKTIKMAIKNMLENLKKSDFDKFCSQLLDRREAPRVRRNKVEGKHFLEIADVLVSTFTEARVVEVAIEILEQIECHQDAEELADEIRELSEPGSSGTAAPSAGATGGTRMAGGKHFVDEHRATLIQRLRNIDPILDELSDLGVVQPESYEKIRVQDTCQNKVRELYDGPLQAGEASKNAFYELLEKHEAYLIADLKKKKK